jgi:hypothetical protein
MQAALLVRFAPEYIAEAFCSSRLAASSFAGGAFGNLAANSSFTEIMERAWPA